MSSGRRSLLGRILGLRRWPKEMLVGTNGAIPGLTNREMQILKCIANGKSNKEIALALSIGEQTVKNHVSDILRKLNVRNRTHAVCLALHNHWLEL